MNKLGEQHESYQTEKAWEAAGGCLTKRDGCDEYDICQTQYARGRAWCMSDRTSWRDSMMYV